MVETRSMARSVDQQDLGEDGWRHESEAMRLRMEMFEARAKHMEDRTMRAEEQARRAEEQVQRSEERLNTLQANLRTRRERIREEGEGEWDGIREVHEERRNRVPWRKLEIPVFSGEDAYGWTQKLERYFQLREVPMEERMQASMVAVEGRALSWYQWWEKCNPNPTWESFKLAVVRRFQPSMIQNPFEVLLALKQEGTVEEYVEQFEKYAGALTEIDQDFVRGVFLNGLKEEIKVELRLFELQTLVEVIQKAILLEQKHLVQNKQGSGNQQKSTGSFRSNSYSRTYNRDSTLFGDKKVETTSAGSVANSNKVLQVGESSKTRGGEYKHLTSAEMREKREKNLCFRCDEPYTRDHKCKNRQLRMIILEEEVEDSVEIEDLDPGEFNSLQLSLRSMAGLTSAKSWKVEGDVNNDAVVILLDCGASHNFISQKLVDRLGLKVNEDTAFTVEVGDGHKIRCRGKCSRLKMTIQKLEIVQDFYLFGLKGIDAVLGLDWLASLGEVKADFGKLELTLKKDGVQYTITGNPSLTKSELSSRALMSLLKTEGSGLLVHCNTLTEEGKKESAIPEDIQGLL